MNGILVNLAQLLRLRGGPQNLPTSWPLMIFLLTTNLVQDLFTGLQLQEEHAAAKSLFAVSLQIAVLTGLLIWRRHPERFAQTMSALAAVGIFFNLVFWALLSLADPATNQPVMALVRFAVVIWWLSVYAHIYRNALSIPFSQGMLVTVLIMAASYVLIETVFIFGTT